MTPATASAFGNADRDPQLGARMGASVRTQRKRVEEPRPGVYAGRSSKAELIRVEDTDRYFLQYCDNPNFRRFLRTLKPIKRNPIERRKELKELKSMSETQNEVDLVTMLDDVQVDTGGGEEMAVGA